MAKGSPGVFLNPCRLPERSRASENAEPECDMDADYDSRLMQDQTPIVDSEQVSRFHLGSDSFHDKLMNKVNLTKNVGIDVNCLDDAYEDLNDDEDVVISRGDRGPSIQFSDRAMDRLCRPWKNALIIKLLGRYGHKREKCELNVKDAETVNGETTIAMGADVKGSSSVGINRAHYESDQSLRGPWMNVPVNIKENLSWCSSLTSVVWRFKQFDKGFPAG
ncbi:unnamed protein product [Prunus armeniaca]